MQVEKCRALKSHNHGGWLCVVQWDEIISEGAFLFWYISIFSSSNSETTMVKSQNDLIRWSHYIRPCIWIDPLTWIDLAFLCCEFQIVPGIINGPNIARPVESNTAFTEVLKIVLMVYYLVVVILHVHQLSFPEFMIQ